MKKFTVVLAALAAITVAGAASAQDKPMMHRGMHHRMHHMAMRGKMHPHMHEHVMMRVGHMKGR